MACKVRLETHQDDPMLNVLQISDCQKSESLNSPTLGVPALKISNAASPPDFSQQAQFLNPTGLGRKLETSNAVQISDSGKEMASKLCLETHQHDPMPNVCIPDSQPPMSLNPPTPLPKKSLKVKTSNAACLMTHQDYLWN